MTDKQLRVVTFNVFPPAYQVVVDWIHQHNHKHVLAVTTPGPTSRPNVSYKEIVANSPRNLDILVTTRLRTVATPLIREVKPDLIVCFSFPYRLTPEICAIPTSGAVNLHPTPLPAYRGPNVPRLIYDGWHEMGATAHWIAPEFDTGNILSRKAAPLPADFEPEVMLANWYGLISAALAEGLEKALDGDPGLPQDHSKASYAAPFTEEERWLNPAESAHVLRRKAIALNFFPDRPALVRLADEKLIVAEVEPIQGEKEGPAPGDILRRENDSIVIQAGDGPVRLQVRTPENID